MEPIVCKLRNQVEVTESAINIMKLELDQIEGRFNKKEKTEINITSLLTSLQQMKSEYEHLKEEMNSSRNQNEDVLQSLSKNHRDLKECFDNFTHTLRNTHL